MDKPPPLDIDALTGPISQDNPAGSDIPFETDQNLDKWRIEKPDEPDNPVKPLWDAVIHLAQDTLQNTSKHFRPAVRLVEARVKKYHFAGLPDGIRLLRRLVEDCWDRVIPVIPADDGDQRENCLAQRKKELNWLDGKLPFGLQLAPVFGSTPKFSFLDYQRAQLGEGTNTKDKMDGEVKATTVEQCQSVLADVNTGLEEVRCLADSLEGKLPEAPRFPRIREELEKSRTVIEGILKKKGISLAPGPGPAQEGPRSLPGGDAPGTNSSHTAASRESAYQKIREAAHTLNQIEPHSPVPILLDRIAKLEKWPFAKIMQEFLEEGLLKQVFRQIGIKEEKPMTQTEESS